MAKKIVYLIGSMEGRTYEEVQFEHNHAQEQLVRLGYEVIDPMKKENHPQNKEISLNQCGMDPQKVFFMDIQSVEKANILLWLTGDVISEGSEVEFASGGYFNRLKSKGMIKKECPIPRKRLVIISPKRKSRILNHFQNMWYGVEVYDSLQEFLNIEEQ